jgi:hypothetical protein
MARIKIKDLPKDQKVSKEEMKKIKGGVIVNPTLKFKSKLTEPFDGKLTEPIDGKLIEPVDGKLYMPN